MLLIQENTGILGSDFEVKETNGDYYIEGIFIKCDTPNGNRRIYPKRYVETGLQRYKSEFIDKNKSIGELDHPIPQRSDAKLSERALRVESLEMQSDGTVVGRAKILKGATKGKELVEIIEEGTAFGTSFRALTQLKNGTDGYAYAGPDIYFRAFDAVLIPSVGEDVYRVAEDINVFKDRLIDSRVFDNVFYGDANGEMRPVEANLVQEAINDFNQKWTYQEGELIKHKPKIDIIQLRKAFS